MFRKIVYVENAIHFWNQLQNELSMATTTSIATLELSMATTTSIATLDPTHQQLVIQICRQSTYAAGREEEEKARWNHISLCKTLSGVSPVLLDEKIIWDTVVFLPAPRYRPKRYTRCVLKYGHHDHGEAKWYKVQNRRNAEAARKEGVKAVHRIGSRRT
jgi:hypothetical protein